jgi:hypothetical protein
MIQLLFVAASFLVPGTNVMILEIFSPKILDKKLAILAQSTAKS